MSKGLMSDKRHRHPNRKHLNFYNSFLRYNLDTFTLLHIRNIIYNVREIVSKFQIPSYTYAINVYDPIKCILELVDV